VKTLLRVLLGVVGVVVLLGVLQVVAAEGIEVVVVHTVDESGEPQQTRIWILEDEGKVYIRGGAGGWTSRVAAHPEIAIEREDASEELLGVVQPDDGVRRRVNRLFREKYGWRDAFISMLIADPSREGAVVIEVVARPDA
jgi:hypothetical protein